MVKAEVGKWYSVDCNGTRRVGKCVAAGEVALSFRTLGGAMFYGLPPDVVHETTKPQAEPVPGVHQFKPSDIVLWNGQVALVEHVNPAGKPFISTLSGDEYHGFVLESQVTMHSEQKIRKHTKEVQERFRTLVPADAVAAVETAVEASGRSPREKGTGKLAEALTGLASMPQVPQEIRLLDRILGHLDQTEPEDGSKALSGADFIQEMWALRSDMELMVGPHRGCSAGKVPSGWEKIEAGGEEAKAS